MTGIGVVSGGGVGVEAFWNWITQAPDGPVRSTVRDFDPSRWLEPKEIKRSDTFSHYAVAAADLAHDGAGQPEVDPRRGGVVLSTVYGAIGSLEAERRRIEAHGLAAVEPYIGAMACEDAPGAMLSQRFGLRGPSKAVIGACAGGVYAIAEGAELVRTGRCDLVLAGASQGPVGPVLEAGFRKLRVLSPSGMLRPFDRRRDGFVFGEGGVVLVLEPLELARERRAPVMAEIVGYANTNDAASLVSPSGTGGIECVEEALDEAGLAPEAIGHVNAHGTGTQRNDEQEAAILHTVFGDQPPPVTSIKRVTGHLAGASGAIEIAAAVLTITRGAIPPVGREVEPDLDLGLDLVSGSPRPWVPAPVLCTSFGLGGHNGCLIVSPVTV